MLNSLLFLLAALLIFGYITLVVISFNNIICSNIRDHTKSFILLLLGIVWLYGLYWIRQLINYLIS